MLNKLSLMLLFYIFFMSVSPIHGDSALKDSPKKIHVVMISDQSYEHEHASNFVREMNEYLHKDNYILTKYYLNCEGCSEYTLNKRFKKALNETEYRDADYLIILGNTLWEQYSEDIVEYKNTHNIKVGLFNIFEHNFEFQYNFREKYSGFFVDYSRISLNTFMFYTQRNGMEFTDFYILRDTTRNSLSMSKFLKKELKSFCKSSNIHTEIITSTMDLKKTVLKLQAETQGLILPLINILYDSSNTEDIFDIIGNHNVVHFELSVMHKVHDNICFNLSHIIGKDINDYRKHPKSLMKKNIDEFLNNYDGKSNVFVEQDVHFVINEKRVKQIQGGHHLLQFKDDFADFLR